MNDKEILDLIPAIIFTKDTDCNITFVNQYGLDLMGFTRDEVIGKSDKEVAGDELAEKYRKNDLEVMESGETKYNLDEAAPNKNGSPISVICTKAPLKDADGKVIGLIGVAMKK